MNYNKMTVTDDAYDRAGNVSDGDGRIDGTVNKGQMLGTHALFLGRTAADAGVFGLEGCGRQEHRRCGRKKNSFRIHM